MRGNNLSFLYIPNFIINIFCKLNFFFPFKQNYSFVTRKIFSNLPKYFVKMGYWMVWRTACRISATRGVRFRVDKATSLPHNWWPRSNAVTLALRLVSYHKISLFPASPRSTFSEWRNIVSRATLWRNSLPTQYIYIDILLDQSKGVGK